MSKFQFKGFIKATNEKILVVLQFFIILLHFIKLQFLSKIEIMQVNSLLSILGFLIITIASIVMLIAIINLGSNLSPFPRPKANGTLITSGIYRFIRHPMYYSLVLISFGVFITKLSLYYLCLTISLVLIIKFKILLEEQYLHNKFKNYLLYKDKVKY
tara:strand:+ start:29 stop:502 length:474 start_codon:yes stop_codon:yes gene_type:complete